MGDGGVACIHLQHSSIMDRLSAPEKALCGGGNNGSSNNVFSSQPIKLAEPELKKKKKKKIKKVVKRVVSVRKVKTLKSEVAAERNDSNSNREIENGEIFIDRSLQNDEVEEGELGTLRSPTREVENGEITPDKPQRSDIKKEVVVLNKWRKGERLKDKEESTSSKPPELEKREITPEKGQTGELGKGELRPLGGSDDEIEKGEFIPDRWHRSEFTRDDFSYPKPRSRYDPGKERSRRRDFELTPPLRKYSSDDISSCKELSRRAGSPHDKDFCRWEGGPERTSRLSSRIVDEDNYGVGHSNIMNQRREYFSGKRLKRQSGHDADSDGSDRDHEYNYKHYRNYAADNMGSKSRRLSDDGTRMVYSDHHSRRSPERPDKISSSSRVSSTDKYTSRHPESSSSSRGVYDRNAHSPVYSDRPPRDRLRQNDHRDRSPVRRERSPYVRDRSPYHSRRTPYGHERSPRGRERSPHGRDRSPHDRSHHSDRRNKNPIHLRKSPPDQGRYHDRMDQKHASRERSPQDRGKSRSSNQDASLKAAEWYAQDRGRHRRDQNHGSRERSPQDRGKSQNNLEGGQKVGASEKLNSQAENKGGGEEKLSQVDLNEKKAIPCLKESQDRISVEDMKAQPASEKGDNSIPQKDDPINAPASSWKESHIVDVGALPEELLSMEEDMDICDTPPHIPVVADSTAGKWVYLDYCGAECGPSRLCELKTLVEEGVLYPDHFIKHLDSNRWVTIENAYSPLATLSFPSIVPDSITQLVSPPEAPGNSLLDNGDAVQCADDLLTASGTAVDFCIDERVAALLEGLTVAPDKELDTVGEALQMTFNHDQWDKWRSVEGFIWHQAFIGELHNQNADDTPSCPGVTYSESREYAFSDQDIPSAVCNSSNWFPGQCSCKGGDWKRNEETNEDRLPRRKLVLNDGFPLCQMPRSGSVDPRWLQKDELCLTSYNRRLDLPPWAYAWPEEKSDSDGAGRSQVKPVVPRGVRGTMLSVVRINACVVKDQDSFISEPRSRSRGKDRYASRSARTHSNSDLRRCSVEDESQSKVVDDHQLWGSRKSIAAINTPKDRVCTVHDLQLHLGDWYYLDGAGHERGPASFSELQSLVGRGTIQKNMSVFRKFDKLWVPVTSFSETDEANAKFHQESTSSSSSSSRAPAPKLCGSSLVEENYSNNSFHSIHPQFIGYMRGKLHELVMRYYKSREFAAAINEVLDPWINAKQPKKQTEKHIYRKSDAYLHASKRARLSVEESEEDNEIDVLQKIHRDEQSFEHLYPDVTFSPEETASCGNILGSWGSLNGRLLARVFHILRSDIKSFAVASSTCKYWRAVARFYRNVACQVDVSSLGSICTDSVLRSIMDGFNKAKINSMILVGCSNISSDALEDILRSCLCLSFIDIRGCSQLAELALKYTDVNWIKGRQKFSNVKFKIKSLTQLTDKNSSNSISNSMGSDVDDISELKDYFASVDRRDSSIQSFHRGFYKRSKVFGARKALSILSGDARVRRWDAKKSEKGYRRMEEFLVSSLKEIMKENTYDFFVQKVADIEYRIKSGYYIRRGISSIKEDISRMCRDAIKAKSRGLTGDMNHIITLFIQLASRLEDSSKSSFQRDEIKSWRDDSSAGSSASSKYKKLSKVENERKPTYRSNDSSLNGVFDGEYVSDREIRRRLLKLNKKSADSEIETSDEYDFSSGTSSCDGETTVSETESDLGSKAESRAGESRGDDFLEEDEGLDSLGDDREWGARMTKASLVPPVTRKYEVIDQYLIVADEENVKCKMQVALPEDYAEKLDALKNGTEELDMELPEVKDYKPRKQLGLEVIEQEVYGIDPYTHNLLLDSMPELLDWTLTDKHWFIEEVLLCTLNKQVRHFTGKGNTPMMYPLQPVIEEVERIADENHDTRTVKMCQGILRAIDSRPDDKYVAYRKGLGVVCNKEGGFGEDDFIVEFLGEVYPAWRWFEKQDGIRSLQKNNNDPAPEFYNIYLERPKGDADGYDLVVVDAMHKANYASRICHSCKPNCEAKVTAVDGHYQIGIYSVREIQFGEEITFDYNSVTESKEEYEASVCLCGSQICRGSYLNLTGEGAFQKVLEEWHGILDRYQLMVEACEMNSVSDEDYYDLGRAGLGSCLLGGLPDWLVAYSARLVRFINFERTKLPQEILKHNLEEKRKYFLDINVENEKSEAEVQAEGVYNQRLQNLAITLDKVRYVMRRVFSDPKMAPPPLERLNPEEAVSFLWSGEGSLVKELLDCISPHSDGDTLNELKSKIDEHDPADSDDLQRALKRSLLWLRDKIRDLPCTQKCRHDAAADLIHIYAHTKSFFKIREFQTVTSPPVFISPLDLGPKYSDKLGERGHEYCKTYGEYYCLGQLIFWYLQTNSEPDSTLFRMSRGCLSLPDVGSFYAKLQKPSRQRVYGPRTVRFMLARMEKQPQRPWPKDRIWSYKTSPKVFGSPMLDSVLKNTPLDREMVHWLKNRISVFHAMWDQ